MSHELLYLVYCDVGTSPTDVDELCLAWTNTAYYAKLRAKAVANAVEAIGGDPKQVRIVPFHNLDEMEQFLSEFDMNAHYLDLADYKLWMYRTCTPLSSIHHALWTTEEVNTGWDLIINTQNDFKEIATCIGILYVAKNLFRNSQIVEKITTLYFSLKEYPVLYVLREQFFDDMNAINNGGTPSEDFATVQEYFKQSTGLDILIQEDENMCRGIFDETELLIRLANMSPIV